MYQIQYVIYGVLLLNCVIMCVEGLGEIVVTKKIERPSTEFTKYRTVSPVIEHFRKKRQANGLPINENEPDLSVSFLLDGLRMVLDLKRNNKVRIKRKIIFHQENGETVSRRLLEKELDECDYHGNVRGMKMSWAIINTCSGIQGSIHYGNVSYYIEPTDTKTETAEYIHYVYNHRDLVSTGVCGNTDNHQYSTEVGNSRKRRDVLKKTKFIEPHNANDETLYNELVLVIDQSQYLHHGKDLDKIYRHCKNIVNHVNFLYYQLNIYVVLVGVVVWTEWDEIRIESDSGGTLNNFLKYRKDKLLNMIHHDNAHLITRKKFNDNVVGLAKVDGICSKDSSGGVNSLSDVVGRAASVLAHEMGHNFGMDHDNKLAHCNCRPDACVMNDILTFKLPVHWSQCSQDVVKAFFEKRRAGCLRNKPTELFGSPTCGNGFLEQGEECDCGPAAGRCAKCCNLETCRLRQNSTCATGACCEIETCSIRNAGSLCRNVKEECDLPEFCTGHSEHCPRDLTKMDSESCDGGQGFCYDGSCRSNTHVEQCRQIWGRASTMGSYVCYNYNMRGDEYGNCGYDKRRDSYIRCSSKSAQCGKLQCHADFKLQPNRNSQTSTRFGWISEIPSRGYCHQLLDNDGGMVSNGASCGDSMICVDQQCIAVTTFREKLYSRIGSACPSNCSGNGVCNSEGQCHCDSGYAPPICVEPGPGGSFGSGPAYDNSTSTVHIILYVVFLGICPLVIIIIVVIMYIRRPEMIQYRSCLNYNFTCSSCDISKLISCKSGGFNSNYINNLQNKNITISTQKQLSDKNIQTQQNFKIENASEAESKLIKALASKKQSEASTSEEYLNRTFNCDFKALLKTHNKQASIVTRVEEIIQPPITVISQSILPVKNTSSVRNLFSKTTIISKEGTDLNVNTQAKSVAPTGKIIKKSISKGSTTSYKTGHSTEDTLKVALNSLKNTQASNVQINVVKQSSNVLEVHSEILQVKEYTNNINIKSNLRSTLRNKSNLNIEEALTTSLETKQTSTSVSSKIFHTQSEQTEVSKVINSYNKNYLQHPTPKPPIAKRPGQLLKKDIMHYSQYKNIKHLNK